MAMQFPPGKRTPEKYPSTGPNYAKWGEQEHNGYVYNPATDNYYYDPVAAAKWKAEAEKEVYGEPPKPPGIWEQGAAASLPMVTGITAMQLAQKPELLTQAAGLLGLGGGGGAPSFTAQSLFGAGGAASAVPDSAAATEALFAGGAGSESGLLGLGGGGTMSAAAPYVLPAAGAAVLGDTLMKDRGKTSNALRGALATGLAAAPWASALGPVGIGAALLGGGLLGLGAGGALQHKSTAEYQEQRRNELRDRGVTGYNEFIDKWEKDMASDPNAGKVVNKDQLTKEDVVGSNGVWDTYGNDWMGKFTTEQRWQIAQKLIDEGLFDTDKGDVVIFSENQPRAHQIADEIVNPKKEEEEKQNATV